MSIFTGSFTLCNDLSLRWKPDINFQICRGYLFLQKLPEGVEKCLDVTERAWMLKEGAVLFLFWRLCACAFTTATTLYVWVAKLNPTLWDPMDCSLPGSSVHGILQPRILEWVAIPFSRGIFLTQGLNSSLLHFKQTLPSEPPWREHELTQVTR